MSKYLEILAVQRPFPFMVDENNRTMFSVNFEATACGAVDQWEEEVASILHAAGLGTLNTDLFIGPASKVPDGDGPYVTIIDTGGTAPNETHNGNIYERLTVQLIVRAKNFAAARTRALAAWRALNGVRNTTVTA